MDDKQPIKITKSLCKGCKYSIRISGYLSFSVKQSIACNYMGDTGQSRIFKDGEMMFPANYCSTYEPKTGPGRPKRQMCVNKRRKKDENKDAD